MFGKSKVVFLVALAFSVILLVKPVTGSPTPPVASFTYTPAAPIFGQVIVFDASASYDPDGGKILTYRWDFDDQTVETLSFPVRHHNYTAVGTYNVTLTVTDNQTETGTTWQIVTVRGYPVATFTYSPESPVEGETVTFNASLSNADGGTIMNYTWDFDDENITTVTDAVITHIYTAEGNYNVTLTVTDDEGLTDTCSQLITVRGYPVASFTHSPDRPLVDETVTFNASLSTADGGTIDSYEWDFGDGSNATGEIVTHKYTTIGNYNVTLTVTDSENLTDTAWTIVTVRKLPFATFTYSPAAPLVDETVTFNASLSTPDGGTIISYEWNFDDGNTTVAGAVITHVYTAFGTYNVTLTITDSEDLTDTFMDTIRILIAPVANFIYSPTMPVFNEIVTFNASASYDPDRQIVNYTWNFDDGSPILTTPNPVTTHNYTAEDTYSVTLTVTDDDGLTDTIWKPVAVYSYIPIHDVAITGVITSATEAYVGWAVNITVVAKNEGTEVESFNVTVYYNAIRVGTKTATLLPSSEITLTFSWDTAGVTPCLNYTISAKATITTAGVEADDYPLNNVREDGKVYVRVMGDVDRSGTVDILDVGTMCSVYAAGLYYPEYDLVMDGEVNIIDVGTVCSCYAAGLKC